MEKDLMPNLKENIVEDFYLTPDYFEKDLNTNFYSLNIDNYCPGNYYLIGYSQNCGVVNSKFIKKWISKN